MNEDTPIGELIAYWRNRRQLSQATLAGLVGRSESWLQKVEAGKRVMDSMSLIITIANVLKVGPWDLQPKLRLPPNGGAPLDPPKGVHAVRRALLAVHPPDREPPTLEQLRTNLEHAKQLRHAGRYEPVAMVVPELLSDARAAAVGDEPQAWWCLAGSYQVASALLRTVGELELAWIAADRAIAAAQRSGDYLMVSVSEMVLALVLLRQQLLEDAGAVCSDGADHLMPTDSTPLAGWTLWGAHQLNEAVIAARRADTTHVKRLLRGARAAAERVGPGPKPYWAAFGPANVGAYEVAVALESRDPVEALRLADTVVVDDLSSPERRAEYCIAVAHAHSLRGDDAATVLVLLEAERHAAQEVRYSVLAHHVVRVCLRRERRSRTPGLRGLAERLGIAT